MFRIIHVSCITHLDGTDSSMAALARQRQADVQKVIKSVAASATIRALQGALQLPCKDVLNDTAAPALTMTPSLLSLCAHRALSLQLLVGRLAHHQVCFCLHINVRIKSAVAEGQNSSSCWSRIVIGGLAKEQACLTDRDPRDCTAARQDRLL